MDEDYDRPRGGIGAGVPSNPAPVNMSGDEAYQRRLAMSQGLQPSVSSFAPATSTSSTTFSGFEPFSVPPSSSFSQSGNGDEAGVPGLGRPSSLSPPPPPLPAAPPTAQSGEEAYLRRLAMSQQSAQPPRAPSPLPFDDEPPSRTPSLPPPAVPPPPVSAPPAAPITADKIQSSKQAAAAIAARLSALAPKGTGPSSSASPPAPGPSTSAPPEEITTEAPKKYVFYCDQWSV